MSQSQDSFRKLLDVLTETSAASTSSGSVATVAQPLMSTQRRSKTTETLNPSIYSAKEQKSVKEVDEEHDSSRRAPQAPAVTDYGLWKNSALIGKEQRQKKSKRSVTSESQAKRLQRLEEAAEREPESELDRPHIQRALKNMSDRHKDEKWSTEELSNLGKRLVAAQAARTTKLDELECGAGRRSLRLAETKGPDMNDPYEQGWFATASDHNPYEKGTPEHKQWAAGQAEREAQPDHYNESVEKNVDMTGKKCTSCKKGTYEETDYHDDMDGVLHCTKCRKSVKRHQTVKSKKKDVSEGDQQLDLFPRNAMPVHQWIAKNLYELHQACWQEAGEIQDRMRRDTARSEWLWDAAGELEDLSIRFKDSLESGIDAMAEMKQDWPQMLRWIVKSIKNYTEGEIDLPVMIKQELANKKSGVAEAFIPPVMDAENWDASERQHREWKNRVIDYEREGYIGKVDVEVNNKAEAQRLTKRINALARSEEENIHCTFANNVLTVRSKTMNSDNLDYFVDTAIEEPYSPNESLNEISTDLLNRAATAASDKEDMYRKSRFQNHADYQLAKSQGQPIDYDQAAQRNSDLHANRLRALDQSYKFKDAADLKSGNVTDTNRSFIKQRARELKGGTLGKLKAGNYHRQARKIDKNSPWYNRPAWFSDEQSPKKKK